MIPFSICVMGGGRTTPPAMDYGSGKSAMDGRVKVGSGKEYKDSDLDTTFVRKKTNMDPDHYSKFLGTGYWKFDRIRISRCS